jgi:hypothetical protein
MDAGLAAIIGVLIGSIFGIITPFIHNWIKSNSEIKKELSFLKAREKSKSYELISAYSVYVNIFLEAERAAVLITNKLLTGENLSEARATLDRLRINELEITERLDSLKSEYLEISFKYSLLKKHSNFPEEHLNKILYETPKLRTPELTSSKDLFITEVQNQKTKTINEIVAYLKLNFEKIRQEIFN